MPTRRYQIHLDPEEHEILRRLAFERRTTISVLVRLAIGTWLMGEKRLQKRLPVGLRNRKGRKKGKASSPRPSR